MGKRPWISFDTSVSGRLSRHLGPRPRDQIRIETENGRDQADLTAGNKIPMFWEKNPALSGNKLRHEPNAWAHVEEKVNLG